MADVRWEGHDAAELAARLALPEVVLLNDVASTMDIAHERAATGAPAGSLVLANAQRSGRGRAGKEWTSIPGLGIWLTLVERPHDARGLGVLSVRTGLSAAAALDSFAPEPVRLKWPNDLYLRAGKLGGILIEIRWRQERPEWVAIGFGVNVRSPGLPQAAALGESVSRLDVLSALIPALRRASAMREELTTDELRTWGARDVGAGRRVTEPADGVVRGLSADGALLVRTANGTVRCASGSLVLAEEP